MTLAERLAREAAPCSAPIICGKTGDYKHVRMCSRCTAIPAIQAAIEKAIRACAKAIERQRDFYPEEIFVPPPYGEHGKTVDACSAHALRFAADHWPYVVLALLTDDVEDGA